MHHLMASYLFQHKTCPLPGLGTLSVIAGSADGDFVNALIKAPVPAIIFETKETDATVLIDFIAAKTNATVLQSIESLGHLTNSLKAAAITNKPATLNGVGDFFTDEKGRINFRPELLPPAFLPAVKAIRVIHPEAEHQILVGDKETTNTVMTEYFTETPVKKDRWWIWAIVIAAVALLAILFYLNNGMQLSIGGNALPIQ
jgi:hypothetical protein